MPQSRTDKLRKGRQYAELRAKGMCVVCKKEKARPNKVQCTGCAAKWLAGQKERRQAEKAKLWAGDGI